RAEDGPHPRLRCPGFRHREEAFVTEFSPSDAVDGMILDPWGHDEIATGSDRVIEQRVRSFLVQIAPLRGEREPRTQHVEPSGRWSCCNDVGLRRRSQLRPERERDPLVLAPPIQLLVHGLRPPATGNRSLMSDTGERQWTEKRFSLGGAETAPL